MDCVALAKQSQPPVPKPSTRSVKDNRPYLCQMARSFSFTLCLILIFNLILIPAPNIDVSPPYLALPHQTSKPFLILIFILNSLRPHLPLDPLIRLAQPILQPGVWFPAH